ncbi:kinase-like protein, partial [Neolentinus lepideus HHB14362 ss-1]
IRDRLRRLQVYLVRSSKDMPPSLNIRGIQLENRDPVTGGGFADIICAQLEGKLVCLKHLRLYPNTPDKKHTHLMKILYKEAMIWHNLHHPHILPFYGLDLLTFKSYICLVAPWMQHGTLIKYVQTQILSNSEINKLLYEVIRGIQYLHSECVVHGDFVIQANILVNDSRQACLADFGLAWFAGVTKGFSTSTTREGSTRWLAPELVVQESTEFRRTPESDIYAFGSICLEVHILSGVLLPVTSFTLGCLDLYERCTLCWSEQHSRSAQTCKGRTSSVG